MANWELRVSTASPAEDFSGPHGAALEMIEDILDTDLLSLAVTDPAGETTIITLQNTEEGWKVRED